MVAIIADPATKPCAKSSVSAKDAHSSRLARSDDFECSEGAAQPASAIRPAPPVPAANHTAHTRLLRRP